MPTPDEVDAAYKRVGMLFVELMAASQAAKEQAALLSADTQARYTPIRDALIAELDAYKPVSLDA